MANKTKNAEVVENASAKAGFTAPESVYTVQELADNHKVFDTYREIVVVALRTAGKETATFAEAKEIIQKFKSKEVR